MNQQRDGKPARKPDGRRDGKISRKPDGRKDGKTGESRDGKPAWKTGGKKDGKPDWKTDRREKPEKDGKTGQTGSRGRNGSEPVRPVFGDDYPETGSENRLEGRNSVLEAYRAGRTVDKLYVQQGLQDAMISTILREARKAGTFVSFVSGEQLDRISETGRHQGVIAQTSSFAYASVEDILEKAYAKGEAPFLFLLDGIEDPHNLGAIIRTANLAGAHGVILPKHHAAGLTAAAVRASAGAVNHTPVAKVTNIAKTIEELKKEGIWFVCADMDGTQMYDLSLTGPVGLVIGSEGEGVSRLVREKCDMTAAIPMRGDIDSLNASVAAGVLAWEIVRQRIQSGK